MHEHIREVLTGKLLDDKRFCAAFCDNCPAIERDNGDGLFNPPVDDCPADFFIGDHACVRAEEWRQAEEALAQAAAVVVESTNKEVYA